MLGPAIQLMRHLRFRGKFILIISLMLIPTGYMAYILIGDALHREQLAQHQLDGLSSIRGFYDDLLSTMEIDAATLSKNTSLPALLPSSANASLASTHETYLQARKQLFNDRQNMTNENDGFAAYANAVGDIIERLGVASGITGNPDACGMTTAVTAQLPLLASILQQSSVATTAVIKRGGFSPSLFVALSASIGDLRKDALIFDRTQSLADMNTSNVKCPIEEFKTLSTAAWTYTNLVQNKVLDPDDIELTMPQLNVAKSAFAKAIKNATESALRKLESRQQQAIEIAKSQTEITVGLILGSMIIIAYFISAFYHSIADTIENFTHSAEELAAGDLSIKMDVSGQDELAEMAQRFNAMAEKFRLLVSDVIQAITRVRESTDRWSSITNETNEGVTKQQSGVQQIVGSIKELSDTINRVTRTTEEAKESAQRAEDVTLNGKEAFDESIEASNNLATEVGVAAETIRKLAEESNNVSEVLDVIGGIAEQTNLLALNAAIEAARAGEQGRGFAVVADEVRTLASRTQQATGEIREMIEQLQTEAMRAVRVMETGRSMSETMVEKGNEAVQALQHITDTVRKINAVNAQIASSTRLQLKVAEEIDQNLGEIHRIAEQTAHASGEAKTAAGQLEQQASHLDERVNKFRI